MALAHLYCNNVDLITLARLSTCRLYLVDPFGKVVIERGKATPDEAQLLLSTVYQLMVEQFPTGTLTRRPEFIQASKTSNPYVEAWYKSHLWCAKCHLRSVIKTSDSGFKCRYCS